MAAIVAGELVFRFSTTAGSAGNTTANTTVSTFLGKYFASSVWAGGGTNDVFPDITGAQNAASQVDYAGLGLHNTNGFNAYQNAVLYVSGETNGGASVAVGVDTTATSAIGSGPANQMLQIANSTTAPAGVSFSTPTTAAGGLSMGSIPNGNGKGFWIRRTAANTAALSGDSATIAVSGDTGSLP